ncbi:MAG: isochorismatase family cysteine hydrolase [Arenicellales bacterium]|nr:isochorismatase family cysteine hydrolase [Arenicellales bacterium]
MHEPTSRDLSFEPGNSGILVIDMQNMCAVRGQGDDRQNPAPPDDYYYSRLEQLVVPNIQKLISAFRGCGIEVMYTVIQSLTKDGRDRSLDHKLSGYNVPKGSPDGKVIDALAPAEDEIVLPKTASGVFNSTNIEYVLRNIGIERLAMVGVYTNQCVESAVRDAADRGFLVTVVEDACATRTPEAHEASIKNLGGYARILSTAEVLAQFHVETGAHPDAAPAGSRP